MTYLCVENHLYLSGKPFALCYNLGDLGYIVRFVLSSGFLSDPVYYHSFTDFCQSYPFVRSRISLGGPFPSLFNPSSSDVK